MLENHIFQNDLTNQIAGFLTEIGLEVINAELNGETFLPGILVNNGRLLVDEEKLVYPGDLLHEAGHLAVAPGALRANLSDEIAVPGEDHLEWPAIAWSYAACLHLRIDPGVVFHEGGYKGKSQGLLLNFSLGVHFGVGDLETAEMAYSERKALQTGVAPYPQMLKWLRD